MPIVLVTPTPVVNTMTSGTVGATVIDTAMVLEHALRRCRVHPSMQTPEIVAMAKENLYLLLLNLSNRGLNLWCVQSDFIGLSAGKSVYEMLGGTIDVTNVVYCQPTRATGTDTSAAASFTTELTAAAAVRRIGLKFDAINPSESVALQTSSDGITFATVQTFSRSDWAMSTWYWYNLDEITTAQYFRIATAGAITVNEFYLATNSVDLPVVQWNRDTWSVINNKGLQGRPSTNYYLEKLLTPRLTLWPVPNNGYDHLQVFVQRQVQDIGRLSQQVEIPQRWVESIIWQLAARLAFELPQVDPAIVQMVVGMADKVQIEAEYSETDGAPIVLQPGISVYTR